MRRNCKLSCTTAHDYHFHIHIHVHDDDDDHHHYYQHHSQLDSPLMGTRLSSRGSATSQKREMWWTSSSALAPSTWQRLTLRRQ